MTGADGQHVWEVHSELLSQYSKYFKVLLESSFKVREDADRIEEHKLTDSGGVREENRAVK